MEATGPARYYSANKTMDMLKGSGGNDELTRQLIQEVRELKGMMRKEIDNTDRTQRILQKWDIQGQPEVTRGICIMKIAIPQDISDANLTSNVTMDDEPAWDCGQL